MSSQKLMWIVWPAFLAACVLELFVFAMVDPQELQWFGQPLSLSRQGVYTLSFFMFWVISMGSNALTVLLRKTPAEVNVCPFTPQERPDGCPQR
jgi:hypothetical protein